MSQMTQGLVSPRYRHFVPEAPSFSVQLPGLKQAGLSGGLKEVKVYGTKQVAAERAYPLDESFRGGSTGTISMYINGVFVANPFGFFGTTIPILDQFGNPVLDANGQPTFIPVSEFRMYNYDATANAVSLTSRSTTPDIGSTVRFETIVGNAIEENTIIPMKKYSLQGASPLDLGIVNPQDLDALFFQGAYRCTLEIISPPRHGVVKISDDTFDFEYRPEVGYFGNDYFSYRVVNCMGQESPAACITLQVGTTPTK